MPPPRLWRGRLRPNERVVAHENISFTLTRYRRELRENTPQQVPQQHKRARRPPLYKVLYPRLCDGCVRA